MKRFFLFAVCVALLCISGKSQMKIASDGNIGINCTPGSDKLRVNGDTEINELTYKTVANQSISINANAQLTVDLGKDTTFCAGLWLHQPDTAHLGSNVIISGGTGPYSYAWSCTVRLSENLVFFASTFLNDTTLLSPYFTETYDNNKKIVFKLLVKDAYGETAEDSIEIRFSRFAYSLKYYDIHITEGDSARFFNIPFIGGGIKPLYYSWYPSTFLSDSTDLAAYAFPNVTTEYSLYASDAIGCMSDTIPFYNIIVHPTSKIEKKIEETGFKLQLEEKNFVVYNNLNNTLLNESLNIFIYGLDGKLWLSDSFNNDKYVIYRDQFKDNIAIIQVKSSQSILFTKKVLLK